MAEAKIYKAISDTMKDIGIVGKNDTNQYDRYNYRGIDAVMNALNPAMIKNHVFVTPTVLDSHREEREGSKGTVMMYTILTVKYTFFTDDGSFIECVVVGEAMDRSDKSTNKAMSAAFKYACFQTFCIPTEEMKDSEEESPEIGKKVEKKTAAKKPAKTDEQKNEELKASVDKTLTPGNTGTVEDRMKKLHSEMERTGVEEKTVLAMFKGLEKLENLTEAQYIAVMNKFSKTRDKK